MIKLLRFVYNLVPFKRHFFEFLKKVYSPPQRLYQHLYFDDYFKVKVSNESSFLHYHFGSNVENDLFWRGLDESWEPQSMKIWGLLSERAEVVLDIGANTGLFSLMTKARNPQAKVYSFEPLERMYLKMTKNIELNKFDIRPLKCAVSNINGLTKIYDLPEHENMKQASLNADFLRNHDVVVAVDVEVLSIQSFADREKLMRIDLVKIDVESHEAEVLEGFGDLIEKFKPIFFIEVIDRKTSANVEAILRKNEYHFFYLIDETNGLIKANQLTPKPSRNYLCSYVPISV